MKLDDASTKQAPATNRDHPGKPRDELRLAVARNFNSLARVFRWRPSPLRRSLLAGCAACATVRFAFPLRRLGPPRACLCNGTNPICPVALSIVTEELVEY